MTHPNGPGSDPDNTPHDNTPHEPAHPTARAVMVGVPALLHEPEHPNAGLVAALTLIPTNTTFTGDLHAGAEPVTVVVSNLLGEGFGLVTSLEPAFLLTLPTPRGWSASVDPDTRALIINAPDGLLYAGALGVDVTPGWYHALATRNVLAVLVASGVEPADPSGISLASIDTACIAGTVVGALIGLTSRYGLPGC